VLPRYLDAVSPIGVSLTGGLDTRMIMACLPKAPGGLVCYTFGGDEGETVDVRLAARVAAACGLPHHVLRLGAAFFADFAALADRTVYITDGCLGIDGAHEIYLNREARRLAPVRLTGNFGSEILRGVRSLGPVGRSPELLDPDHRRHLDAGVGEGCDVSTAHPVSVAAFKGVAWKLSGIVQAAGSQASTRTPYLDNDVVALAYQTPPALRRSPLPALRLVKRLQPELSRIPTTRGHTIGGSRLASRLQSLHGTLTFKLDYWYNEEPPARLSFLDPILAGIPTPWWPFRLHRYISYRRWFRRPLAGYLRERLVEARVRQNPLWNPAFLAVLASDQSLRRRNCVRDLGFVLTLEAIDRLLLRPPRLAPLVNAPSGVVRT
jgi:asparagine synthase (glutamine-hydrolysing)